MPKARLLVVTVVVLAQLAHHAAHGEGDGFVSPSLKVISLSTEFPRVTAGSDLDESLQNIVRCGRVITVPQLRDIAVTIERLYLENGMGTVHVYMDVQLDGRSACHVTLRVHDQLKTRPQIKLVPDSHRRIEVEPSINIPGNLPTA